MCEPSGHLHKRVGNQKFKRCADSEHLQTEPMIWNWTCQCNVEIGKKTILWKLAHNQSEIRIPVPSELANHFFWGLMSCGAMRCPGLCWGVRQIRGPKQTLACLGHRSVIDNESDTKAAAERFNPIRNNDGDVALWRYIQHLHTNWRRYAPCLRFFSLRLSSFAALFAVPGPQCHLSEKHNAMKQWTCMHDIKTTRNFL